MLTVRTSENTVITSFRLISERQDFSSVRTAENTVRARARIHSSGSFAIKNSRRSRFCQLGKYFLSNEKQVQIYDGNSFEPFHALP